MRDNRLVQFAVLVLAVTAGQLLLKFGASYLPDGGPLGAVKQVLASI
jgi:hypothetical protein